MDLSKASNKFYESQLGQECKKLRTQLDELHFSSEAASRRLSYLEALLIKQIMDKVVRQ